MSFTVNKVEYNIVELDKIQNKNEALGYINIVEYVLLKEHMDAGIKEKDVAGNPGQVARFVYSYYSQAIGAITFLATNSKAEFIGLIILSKDKNYQNFIASIYTDGPYRNKGVGISLMSYAISYLKKANQDTVSVKVGDFNTKAIKFYKKFGFKRMENTGNKMSIYTVNI